MHMRNYSSAEFIFYFHFMITNISTRAMIKYLYNTKTHKWWLSWWNHRDQFIYYFINIFFIYIKYTFHDPNKNVHDTPLQQPPPGIPTVKHLVKVSNSWIIQSVNTVFKITHWKKQTWRPFSLFWIKQGSSYKKINLYLMSTTKIASYQDSILAINDKKNIEM